MIYEIQFWTDIAATTVPTGTTIVRSGGYDQTGIGAASYRIDDDQLSSTGSRWRGQSANGIWFRLSEPEINPQQFGARYDGTDDTDALTACLEASKTLGMNVDLLVGTMVCSEAAYLPFDRAIRGSVVLDFSAVTSSSGFPEGACVLADAGPASILPDLAGNVQKGDFSLSLASVPSPTLHPGDLIAIYNPAPFSWIKQWSGGSLPSGQFAAGNRANYCAGEMVVVRSISGSTVTLQGALRADYAAADVEMWRMPNRRLKLSSGALTVRAPSSIDCAMRVRRARDSDLSGLDVQGGKLTALELSECHQISGIGMSCEHRTPSGLGEDYGLSVVACDRVNLQGDFSGHRHGVTVGTTANLSGNLCLPWRDVAINVAGGTMTARADVNAFGGHGCGEGLRLGGVAYGGVLLAGGDISINCSLKPIESMAAWPLLTATELWSWSMDLTVAIDGTGIDPVTNTLGLIDFGSNGAAPDAGCVRPGMMTLRGTLYAPDTIRPIKMFSNGAPGQTLGVGLGLAVTGAPANALLHFGTNAGSPVFDIDAVGFNDLTGNVSFATGPGIPVRHYP